MEKVEDLSKRHAVIEAVRSEDDPRRPYEAPRVLIKRSVAAATLLTVHSPSSTGIVSSGG